MKKYTGRKLPSKCPAEIKMTKIGLDEGFYRPCQMSLTQSTNSYLYLRVKVALTKLNLVNGWVGKNCFPGNSFPSWIICFSLSHDPGNTVPPSSSKCCSCNLKFPITPFLLSLPFACWPSPKSWILGKCLTLFHSILYSDRQRQGYLLSLFHL